MRPHAPGECPCGLIHSVAGAQSLNETARITRALPPELQHVLSAATSAALVLLAPVLAAVQRLIADRDAEIDALRAELDTRSGHQVMVCMERDAELMQAHCAAEPVGTILRFTDTGGELEKTPDGWQPRVRR